MSDSSWQQAVLGELGVARRGLRALNTPSSAVPGADWGADSAPRPVAEPPVPGPVPDVPPPPPSFAAPPEPAPVNPFAQPPADVPAAQPADPFSSQPQIIGSPPSVPQDPFGAAPQPAVPQDPFGPPQPVVPQDPFGPPQPVVPQDPFGPPQSPPDAAAEAPQVPFGSAPQPNVPQDPFGPPQPAAPQEPDDAPQPAAGQSGSPLFNPDFDPELAIAPSVTGAPPMQGAPPPQVGTEREPATQPGEPEPPAAAAPVPQRHAGQQGAVPTADELLRKQQHGDPLMRRVGRGVRKAVGATGSHDAATQAEIAALLQRPVPSYRQIAVASVRGGAGKTSISALLASELARNRTDRVLAVDADAELGSLPLRLGVRSELSLFDLAGRQPRTFEEAAHYLARTEAGLWVLSSTRGGRIAGEFTIETFQTALASLSRYFAAAVVDCGAGILTEVHRGILGQTHGLVLVTPGTADGALSARGALEWFAGNGQQALLARTVIAMVTHAPQVGADLERAREMLSAWGLPVVNVPYDRHLAAGGALDPAKLGDATRAAAGQIAAEVFARALGGGGVVR
ncbi:hypothetical protein [Actinomadura flavalba]|uniref:nucleotide-binding protein n=1 Tax=Actinomadura flavalba TaxID=1120938 RepID=UPI00036F56D2|nr:hypothetical protein [Actinomadura flavalba]